MSKQLDSYIKKVRPRHKDKVIAHADVRSSGPSGKGKPFRVRRMASSAPMAFGRPVSITDLMSA